MIKQEFAQEIHAPLEKVFAFVTDFRNAPQWQNGVIESSQSPDGPTRSGTKVKTVRTLFGQRLEAAAEVVEFVPDRKVVLKTVSGPIQFRLTQTFTSMPGGTKVEIQMEMEAGGFFKLAEGALAGNMKKEFEAQGQKLKALLEDG